MDPEHLSPFEAFDLAITRAGSQAALAKICGCTPGNINQLVQKKSRLPAEYVLAVEAATGVSKHLLRPDIYPVGLQACLPPSDDGIAALGELAAGAAPEWPVAPADTSDADETQPKLQAAGAPR